MAISPNSIAEKVGKMKGLYIQCFIILQPASVAEFACLEQICSDKTEVTCISLKRMQDTTAQKLMLGKQYVLIPLKTTFGFFLPMQKVSKFVL